MKPLSHLLLMLFTVAVGMGCMAQSNDDNPIKWRMSVKMTSPDDGVITLRAIVSDGWHLYGTELPKDGPVPTEFNFSASQGVTFVNNFTPDSRPVEKTDPTFGMKLKWWDKDVVFTRKFKLKSDAGTPRIEGTVRFMGCNDINCLPPKTLSFNYNVKPYKPAK